MVVVLKNTLEEKQVVCGAEGRHSHDWLCSNVEFPWPGIVRVCNW